MLQWVIFLTGIGLIPSVLAIIATAPTPTLTIEDTQKFETLPVGIMVGSRSVMPSILVHGLENGSQAIHFKQWLVPFDEIIQAAGFQVTHLDNGYLELHSPGLVTRINPEKLTIDPELGLVLSIQEVEMLLHVPTQFDIAQYAIVLMPPWLEKKLPTGQEPALEESPVILEGLPKIKPSLFSFTAIQQQLHIAEDENNFGTLGNLIGVGTLGKGSWYIHTDQSDMLDAKTWHLGEAQYFQKGESFDYAIGSQPSFWQNGGDYLGITVIKRAGFSSLLPSASGFEPNERRQSSRLTRTIVGEAEPGTLIRLVEGFGNVVIAETLVDSSGIYRFDHVMINPQNSQEYNVLLYPHGVLTAEPIIRKARSVTRMGQLDKGASALIFSSGMGRKITDNFFGEVDNFQGGIGYRRGISDTLTLGGGIVYDEQPQPLVELFYQPLGWLPLGVSVSALKTRDQTLYNSDVMLQFSNKLGFYVNSDPLSKRFQLTWNAFPQLSLATRGDTRTDTLATGMTFSKNAQNLGGTISTEIDSNQQVRWNLSSYIGKYQLNQMRDDINTAMVLSYNLSGRPHSDLGHTLVFNRETQKIDNQLYELNSLTWHYQSPAKSWEGRNLWEMEGGYSNGSQGSGLLLALATSAFSGITVQFRYQNISIISAATSLFLEVSSNFKLHPKLDKGNNYFENLRGEGGIFIQPFMDKNANGVYDKGEIIYTEQADLLFILNNKPLPRSEVQVTNKGIYTQLAPGTYRLDLDPAGYPVDGTPTQSAYAVNVVAGSYTTITVPFTISYTIAGVVQDSQGTPVIGAKVEAVSINKSKKALVITNSAGIFFLENLSLGTYQLFVDGQLAQPNSVEIRQDSESTQEVTLQK